MICEMLIYVTRKAWLKLREDLAGIALEVEVKSADHVGDDILCILMAIEEGNEDEFQDIVNSFNSEYQGDDYDE